MPEWVVPVLRLVSSTHVEPTTGVVLSADGLVLVPGNFATREDEIVVLDGGTDIIRHGRPARLRMNFPGSGVAVLQADGLHRTGAPLAPASPARGDGLRLRAFPPAEQIAEGAPPLDVPTTVFAIAESGTPVLAAEASLPNVTGALLDSCGNLAGMSLADGLQSMSPAPSTQYRWAAELHAVFTALHLPVSGTVCATDTAAAEMAPPAVAEANVEQKEVEPSTAPEAVREEAETDQQPTEPPTAGTEPTTSPEALPPSGERGSPIDEEPPSPLPETSRPVSLWPWLLAALLLLGSGVIVRWLRRSGRARWSPADSQAAKAGDGSGNPAESAPAAEELAEEPVCRLILRGELANGQPLEVATKINARAVNAEIGRGTVDLAIDSPSVSRRHARLGGTREALTLTDLGSSNGSSIDGVPCLEGEIMYVEPGASIVLGDARFTVSIEDGEAAEGGL